MVATSGHSVWYRFQLRRAGFLVPSRIGMIHQSRRSYPRASSNVATIPPLQFNRSAELLGLQLLNRNQSHRRCLVVAGGGFAKAPAQNEVAQLGRFDEERLGYVRSFESCLVWPSSGRDTLSGDLRTAWGFQRHKNSLRWNVDFGQSPSRVGCASG